MEYAMPHDPQQECTHRWFIESPHQSLTVKGVCDLCGAERHFDTHWTVDNTIKNKRGRISTPSDDAEDKRWLSQQIP